ncbi:hypothetical protein IW140_006557 [Coemansia sp. RSA 1813]|nr:hypothetical protein EV178_006496 [Coemansia sp. RSA 1646]KAJ1764728.1 hypothetical protein LPJ74_006584 [Coemansia sp. RSA 1843]KAJ2085049.1 hypothetical protein IW138_006506 [Coemansia sp. RSA 986]KAJ2210092.1 hypothetical protein EV179_006437 [Coemansia sp. RSA 487]KAJ2561595.1 hypothetical protein IW140_006557 [Coemansia sp. RSA 1813]
MSAQVSNEKPTLNGVRIRARKRDAKAQAKYEPEDFRESVFQVTQDIEPKDYTKISSALDSAGNTLDYRRYGDTFFELLVTGGLIAPGGIIEYDEEYGRLPFCLFELASGDDPLTGAKSWTALIHKLTRRYKYLERIFSKTSQHVLENVHRYSEDDNRKLAVGMGVLISSGFLTMDPLRTLQKEHLTKDGVALRFFTDLLRIYLKDASVAQLRRALAKAKIDQLIDFFPPNKRDDDCFARHFEAEDMPELIELHAAARATAERGNFVYDLIDIVNDAKLVRAADEEAEEDEDEDDEDKYKATNVGLAKAAKTAMRANKWDEPQVVVLVWDAIMSPTESALKPEQMEQMAFVQIKRHSPVLELFTSEPKSEIALLKHIQAHAYRDPRLTKYFGRIVYELYSADVLSDSAIIFWAAKGANPEGKAGFLEQTKALVRKLETMASDEDDSDDE